MPATLDIPKAELARLEQAMLRISSSKNVPMEKVVRNAARDFTQAAYRATPTAKVRQTNFLYLGKKNPPFGGYGRPRWVKKEPTQSGSRWDPPFRVARGYSKSSWIGMMRELGMSGKRTTHQQATRYGDAYKMKAPGKVFVQLINRLPWIAKLDRRANIRRRGVAHAVNRIEKELVRMGEKIEREFIKK